MLIFYYLPTQFKIDIYSEFTRIVEENYEIIVFQAIITELERKIDRVSEGKVKLQHQYQLARQIMEKVPHRIIDEDRIPRQLVDDFLLDQALKLQNENVTVYLATNDKELRKKCKDHNIRTIIFRSQKKLVVE